MFLIRLALKNLTRHKKRTLITAGVIALAIFFYIFLDSLLIGMTNESFKSLINFESGHLQVVDENYWEERDELPLDNLISLNRGIEEKIRAVEGYKGMTPELNFGARLNNGIDELPITGKGIVPGSAEDVFATEQYFVEGSMFSPGEYKAVMGKSLADLMELKTGDYITLLIKTKDDTFNTIDAEISGLVHTPNPNINENFVYVPLGIARQALNVEGKVSRIVVRLDNREKAGEIATTLREEFKKGGTSLGAYSWRQSAESLLAMTRAQETENQIILGIILLIAVVGIVNTVILSGLERMEEIGMMKALGLKEREIVTTFVIESTGIGIIGGALGCLMGAISVAFFHKYGLNFMAMFGEQNVSQFGIPILGRIYGGWNPEGFAFVFSFGVIVTLVVSIFPSLWAAKKDPVKAIYHR